MLFDMYWNSHLTSVLTGLFCLPGYVAIDQSISETAPAHGRRGIVALVSRFRGHPGEQVPSSCGTSTILKYSPYPLIVFEPLFICLPPGCGAEHRRALRGERCGPQIHFRMYT